MNISVDRQARVPLYLQIRNQIRDEILRGNLAAGAKLPPERRLAEQLGVNRTTIMSAYRELEAEGLLQAHVGRGTIVSRATDSAAQSLHAGPEWSDLFARQPESISERLACEAADLASRSGAIPLATGVPDPALYPLELFGEAWMAFLRRSSREDFSGSPVEGFAPLRGWLSDWLSSRGLDVQPDNVLITSGSTQALDLISRAFIEPGDQVVTETPTSLSALRIFASARARVVPVPVDVDGIDTDALAHVFSRSRPKLVYALPAFQNPTGVTLSAARRDRLVHLARLHGVPIVEDDPYSELSFDAPPPAPLAAMDRAHVIYVGTFSKLLFPGLRVGWIAAPRPAIERLMRVKQTVDLFTSPLVEGALWQLLESMDWPAYLSRITNAYRRRRDVLLAGLDRHMPDGCAWRSPGGGFYVWLRLPDGILARHLLMEAYQAGVAFLPGDVFSPDGGSAGHLRLNFSYAPLDHLAEGARRLSSALDVLCARRGRAQPASMNTARAII